MICRMKTKHTLELADVKKIAAAAEAEALRNQWAVTIAIVDEGERSAVAGDEGIDVAGTLRALVTNAQAGGVRQGGSSISQQLAKNLFLSNERTLERKINEAFLAIWLETRLTKNEILKLYLDRSYLGGGAYGVEAASQFYFGKSVRDINLSEAAVIAGLFKAPTQYAPHANPAASRARTNVVLFRMLDAGFITQGELLEAQRHPAEIVQQTASHEIGILAEAVAKTQEIANAVVGLTRVTLLHSDFPGRLCKEGNMAFPFSPSDIERGAIYQFSLRHVVEPDDPLEMFPIEYEDV